MQLVKKFNLGKKKLPYFVLVIGIIFGSVATLSIPHSQANTTTTCIGDNCEVNSAPTSAPQPTSSPTQGPVVQNTPTSAPQVQGSSTGSTPTPTPKPAPTSTQSNNNDDSPCN